MNSSINLKIYDQSDEIIAEFEEKRLRWGLVEDVVAFPAAQHTLFHQCDIQFWGNGSKHGHSLPKVIKN